MAQPMLGAGAGDQEDPGARLPQALCEVGSPHQPRR